MWCRRRRKPPRDVIHGELTQAGPPSLAFHALVGGGARGPLTRRPRCQPALSPTGSYVARVPPPAGGHDASGRPVKGQPACAPSRPLCCIWTAYCGTTRLCADLTSQFAASKHQKHTPALHPQTSPPTTLRRLLFEGQQETMFVDALLDETRAVGLSLPYNRPLDAAGRCQGPLVPSQATAAWPGI